MSIEELKTDSEEFAKFLNEASRIRVKNALLVAKAEVDKEIVNLEMKARQAAERKLLGEGAAQRRYLVELDEYGFDQSDKFVKLFVTLGGVQNVDESNVTVKFTENSMNLLVSDLDGKDYGLTMNNLLEAIDVEKSYRKVKTGMVAIYMKKKVEGKHWEYLTTIQKRIKSKKEPETKTDDSAEDPIINIMKKMYNSGDAKTKQMIAKAWTESQGKAAAGSESMDI